MIDRVYAAIRRYRPIAALALAAAVAWAGPARADSTDDAAAAATAAAFAAFFPATADDVLVTVAAVGDVLLHDRVQRQGNGDPDGYRSLWAPMEPWIRAADVAYFNLEGTMAEGIAANGQFVADADFGPDQWVYGGYPLFNYPPIVGPALAAAGFDVAGTANNHAMDRRTVGVRATHELLSSLGMQPSGTRTQTGNPLDWPVVTEVRGVRVGWLACAHHTNGLADPESLVLLCDDEQTTQLIEIMLALRIADGVIVTPHWGEEFETTPNWHQRQLAARFAEAGAMAVIGSHPHVLQGWERIDNEDGSATFVAYSLGNFISNQQAYPRPYTIVLFLGLGWGADGRLAVNAVRYLPANVDASRIDGRDRVVRPARPDGDWASKAAFCLAVRLFGADWLHPPVETVILTDAAMIAHAAATPSPADACR